jgi:hypothetical protein
VVEIAGRKEGRSAPQEKFEAEKRDRKDGTEGQGGEKKTGFHFPVQCHGPLTSPVL